MARRSKQDKSEELFLGLLISAPWWVPFVLAILVYALLSRINVVAAFLWACIFVFAGIVIPFIKSIRNELILSATDLPAIRQMSWQSFERLVGEAYRRQGYVVVELGGPKPDGGIDLILHKPSEKVIVQCKHWQTKTVGVALVRELRGVVAREKAKRGILVTSGGYTEEALAEAKGQPIELIDGPKLCTLLHKVRLQTDEIQSETLGQQPTLAEGGLDATVEVPTQYQPLCPACSKPMVMRTARKGANAGGEFWGCSTFPRCEGTRPV